MTSPSTTTDIVAPGNNNSYTMIIGKLRSGVQGTCPFYLDGMLHRAGILILMDSCSTHNIINTNFACSNGLHEHGVYTTILVGNWKEVPCHSASFNIPIHISNDIFHIDVLLLDISNNIDIILGLPWLTILGHVTWDFTTMELLYFCNEHPYILNIVPRQQAPTTNLALIAHQLGVHIAWSSTTHIPHPVTNRSQHVRLPNSLNNINIPDNIILTYMC